MAGRHRHAECRVVAGVAAGIGEDVDRTEVDLPLTVAGQIRAGAGKEFDTEMGAGHAVQRAGKNDVGAAGQRGSQHRGVLTIVCAGVGIARVVGANPVVAQVDAERSAGRYPVAKQHIARRIGAGDVDAAAGVVGDDVARSGRRAADQGIVGSVCDAHAIAGIADGRAPVQAHADAVALDDAGVGGFAIDEDADQVAGDHVAGARDASTNGGGRGTGFEHDPRGAVAPIQQPGAVGADQVAGHGVARGGGAACAVDDDGAAGVARNHVALGRRGAADHGAAHAVVENNAVVAVADHLAAVGAQADGVAADQVAAARVDDFDAVVHVARDKVVHHRGRCGAELDIDAVLLVSDGRAAGGIGADAVALNGVARGSGTRQMHAVEQVAGDEVAVRRSRAAHGVVCTGDINAVLGVGFGRTGVVAGRVEPADVVAGDGVAVGAGLNNDARAVEIADHKAADRAAVGAGRQLQARGGEIVAIEHKRRLVAVGSKAVVGAGVEDDGIGDRWQRRRKVDQVFAGAGNPKEDAVGPAAAVGAVVGRDDRLAQADEAVAALVLQQRVKTGRVTVDCIGSVTRGRDDDRALGVVVAVCHHHVCGLDAVVGGVGTARGAQHHGVGPIAVDNGVVNAGDRNGLCDAPVGGREAQQRRAYRAFLRVAATHRDGHVAGGQSVQHHGEAGRTTGFGGGAADGADGDSRRAQKAYAHAAACAKRPARTLRAGVAVAEGPVDLHAAGLASAVAVGNLLQRRIDECIGGIGIESQAQRAGTVRCHAADGRSADADGATAETQRSGGTENVLPIGAAAPLQQQRDAVKVRLREFGIENLHVAIQHHRIAARGVSRRAVQARENRGVVDGGDGDVAGSGGAARAAVAGDEGNRARGRARIIRAVQVGDAAQRRLVISQRGAAGECQHAGASIPAAGDAVLVGE